MNLLMGKIFIDGDIILKTGLRIGGGNNSIEIGGIDNNVIKNHRGEPYIPGSSLKGKLRSLLEISTNRLKDGRPCNCGECSICSIFGVGANENKQNLPTRIIVRDAFLNEDIKKQMYEKQGQFKRLELNYTESKYENTIDRLNSKATPRLIERVPEGASFRFQIIYSVFNNKDIDNFNDLIKGMKLLEDDYLGSNGSRGYGQVEFDNLNIKIKVIKDYKTKEVLNKSSLTDIDSVCLKEKLNELIEIKGV
ncbi:type III-A CRISPR-associated RAMP protein Csm3 [Clostridium botulinum]|uniref:type III-A CRISPR-associated RAMP protein Csm3 n=1 Tax=Clostridium botulinum TaxID=1491 RepID=UPI003309A045|nr:type III-A CRISPR-associated RAMP protein Csm3 [Clostridium botulinum]HDK7215897.1 type III-A CRISPR-associated RAMP protein Csm3 [Clostridium botulinum]